MEAERAVLAIASWSDEAERAGEPPDFQKLKMLLARALAHLDAAVGRMP
jgi:hypothetical protein